jgi:PhnB protein
MTVEYRLNPYLTVRDAAAAIDFYGKAFGATEVTRMPAQDGKRLMHAEIKVNGAYVMLSDEFPEYTDPGCPAVSAPSAERPSPVGIALHYKTPGDVDKTYARAVEAGCAGTLPPNDTFWKARFAMVRDPFGHRWMLNAPLPQ